LLAIVTQRARESSTIEFETDIDQGQYVLAISTTAQESIGPTPPFGLRISTLVAALHKGELHIDANAAKPCIALDCHASRPAFHSASIVKS
jgi:hypothetical protein